MRVTPADAPMLEGVDYFDGRSAQAHPVALRLADGALHISGAGMDRSVPVNAVQWPERTRHGQRVAHLTEGGSLEAHDSQAWDDWLRRSGRQEAPVVRVQQSWRGAMLSVAA